MFNDDNMKIYKDTIVVRVPIFFSSFYVTLKHILHMQI